MKRYVISLIKHDSKADYTQFQRFIEGNVSFRLGDDGHVLILKNQAPLDQLFDALKNVIQPEDKIFIAEVLDWRSHPADARPRDAKV